MKSNDPDQDLRAAFAQVRRLDHAAAPAWNPRCLEAAPQSAHARRAGRLWLPVSLTAAASIALTSVFFLDRPEPRPSLVKALPVLLPSSPAPEPLLAGLDRDSWDMGVTTSDFLLPTHLTISIP